MAARDDVIWAYHQWLDRTPSDNPNDENYDATWTSYIDKMEDDGWSLDQVIESLQNSPEFDQKTTDKVNWWFRTADFGPKRDPTAQEMTDYKDAIKTIAHAKEEVKYYNKALNAVKNFG